MEKTDARTLSSDAQYELHRQVVRLRKKGTPNKLVAEIVGMSETQTSAIWRKYLTHGLDAIKPGQRGRRAGEKRTLTPEQESEVRKLLLDKTPDQLKLAFALWTRDAVKLLIKQEYGVDPPVVLTANSFTYTDPDHADLRDTETITNGGGFALTAGVVTYDYNNLNQLLNSTNPDKTYGYDDDGNMTSFLTLEGYPATATYDAENRLVSATYTDGGGAHSSYFTYGADGFLVKQVVNGSERRFVLSGGLVLQERNSSNVLTRKLAWDPVSPGGIGGLLEITQSAHKYNPVYDGKGNVSAVLDSSRNPAAEYRYDSFGVLMSQSLYNGFVGQPYQFSTKRYYPQLGLSYYGFRFYAASLGRWVNRDPLGEAGGFNLYGFVGNGTVNVMDYWGLKFILYVVDTGGRHGPTYGADFILWKNGTSSCAKGTSWPDTDSKNPGIKEGVYKSVYRKTGHHGKEAGIRLHDGGAVPTIGINPNNNYSTEAVGVNVHKGGKNVRNSEGCLTIKPGDEQKIWDMLDDGEGGDVVVSRPYVR